MYALADYEHGCIDPIHRILIFLVRAAFSSRIQISLLEVHGRRVQLMVGGMGSIRAPIFPRPTAYNWAAD
jgi:hypothetical protein